MKPLQSEKGIALVTSLMLTLISLTIVMALLYMITQGTKVSGQMKTYRTALDASYGGAEIFTKDMLPYVLRNYSSANMVNDVTSTFSGVNMQVLTTQACLQAKLTRPTKDWPAGCDASSAPKRNPDISMTLQGLGDNKYVVYSKIVDTKDGNSDVSGLQLEGSGVAEGSSVITPQHFPYIYRLEIQGERAANSNSQANIEVLYAY